MIDGQTDGRTDGGDCNMPIAFLKGVGIIIIKSKTGGKEI